MCRRFHVFLLILVVVPFSARGEETENPLTDFKDALPISQHRAANKAILMAYAKRLESLGERIRSTSDLCRVLNLLSPGRFEPARGRFTPTEGDVGEVHEKLRAKLVSRLQQALNRDLFQGGSKEQRLALLAILRHSAEEEEASRPPEVRFFPGFARDVLRLAISTDEQAIRLAALRTLAHLDPPPQAMADLVKRSLGAKAAIERREAAALLATVLDFTVIRSPAAGSPTRVVPRYKNPDLLTRRAVHLLPLAAIGSRDTDPLVRQRSLKATAHAANEMRDLIPSYQTQDSDLPSEMRLEDFGELATVLAKPVQELTRALPSAVDALVDNDLNVSLAAHLALEKVASLSLTKPFLIRSLPSGKGDKDAGKEKDSRERKDGPAIDSGGEKTNGGQGPKDSGQDKKDRDLDRDNPNEKLDPVSPKQLVADLDQLTRTLTRAVPALAKSLAHKEIRVRLAAIYVLETLAADAAPASEALAKSLKDDNRFVRWGATRALRNMAPQGTIKVIPALADALADDSPDVRHTAAAALSRCGVQAKGALAALTKALESKDEKSRMHAARALGSLAVEAKPARPALVKLLRDENADVRIAAATSLGRTGPLDAVTKEALVAALEDEHGGVQAAAANALLAK